ncbi:MAG: DUF2089 domain-containing protein [Chloroflexi bacterium]|nr:MAG: DUF2089 domain-containing protein [Chloroflexota bacterium]
MYPLIGRCPVCQETLIVTRLYCRNCDTSIEGHFDLGRFHQLTPEQLHFIETFIRCEGKLNRVQEELGLSYPTVRSRLREVIRALGYEIPEEEGAPPPQEERMAVLQMLQEGKITAQEALNLLRQR